jgi:hypothetical protein
MAGTSPSLWAGVAALSEVTEEAKVLLSLIEMAEIRMAVALANACDE